MPTVDFTTPNTSHTPNGPGRWVLPKYGPPSVLKWESWDPMTELSDDKVLIRVIVGAIGGVETIQRAGGYIPGYELVGEVLALGAAVPSSSNLEIGDMVAALPLSLGAHATHIVLPYNQVMRLDKTDDPVKMACLPINYMTAWGLLTKSGVTLPPGSSILIGSASGGCGTAMAQLVKVFNMEIKMIGTCSASKLDYLRSLGVQPIDRNAPDLVEQVLKHSPDGKGVDVAFDSLCSQASIDACLACVKKSTGKVIVFGFNGEVAADGSGMAPTTENVLVDRLAANGIPFFALDVAYPGKPEVDEFYAIVEKMRSGELEPVVARLWRLSEAVEVHEALVEASQIKGKMLFIVDAELAEELGVR